MKARPYQDEIFSEASVILRDDRHLLLCLCVSAGKTDLTLALSSWLHSQKSVRRVIILTPSRAIRSQFQEASQGEMQFSDQTVTYVPVTAIEASSSRRGSLKLDDYLLGDSDTFKASTYDLFRGLDWNNIPNLKPDWSDTLVIVDEGHHTSSGEGDHNDISRCVQQARGYGARTLRLTGTPGRLDGRDVIGDDHVITRSLMQHMLEGYAPQRILTKHLPIEADPEQQALPVRAAGVQDWHDVPSNLVAAANAIAEDWEMDGRPHILVRAQARNNQRHNEAAVEALRQAFRSRGEEILDLSASDPDSDVNFERLLSQEKRRVPLSELPKVVVALKRLDEGVNLPSRSHLYLMGVPSGLPALEQLLGRVMRSKTQEGNSSEPIFPGYPQEWQNTSKVCLVTERAVGDNDIPWTLLRATVHLAGYNLVRLAAQASKSRKDFSSPRGTPERSPRVPMDPIAINKVHAYWIGINGIYKEWQEQQSFTDRNGVTRGYGQEAIDAKGVAKIIHSAEKNPDAYPSLMAWVDQVMPTHREYELAEEETRTILKYIIGSSHPEKVAEKLKMSSDVDAALERLFEEFKGEVQICLDQYGLEGFNIEKYAKRYRELHQKRNLDQVRTGVREFKRIHNRWPEKDEAPIGTAHTLQKWNELFKRGEVTGQREKGTIYDAICEGYSWFEDAWRVSRIRSDATRPDSHLSPEELARRHTPDNPILKYFPQVVNACEVLGVRDMLKDLSLQQAVALGKQRTRDAMLEQLKVDMETQTSG